MRRGDAYACFGSLCGRWKSVAHWVAVGVVWVLRIALAGLGRVSVSA